MNNKILSVYRRLRANPVSMLVGRCAEMSLRDARTIVRFEELAAFDSVRITSEPEQESYFSVFGKPDTDKERKEMEATLERLGCVAVMAEYRDENDEWQLADSIGMCVYENAESPFENCYVAQLMQAAIDAAEKVAREPAERAYWEARDVVTA